MVIRKGPLADMMKMINELAGLSQIYTNHCIRHTTATGMHSQCRSLKEIQNVTKHINLQSLDRYNDKPTFKEKEKYSSDLFNYIENRPPSINTDSTNRNQNENSKQEIVQPEPQNVITNKEINLDLAVPNVEPLNAIIPIEPNLDQNQNQMVQNNQLNKPQYSFKEQRSAIVKSH